MLSDALAAELGALYVEGHDCFYVLCVCVFYQLVSGVFFLDVLLPDAS